MFNLKDRVALVTGASQGIGRATALALATSGARVTVAARNAEKLASVVAEIAEAGGEAFAVQMDVADAEQVKAGFRQSAERFGKLDILVNNAAITRDGLAVRMKADDWDAVIRTNLTGAHLCTQQALAAMMRQRYGRIINVTSVVAETGNAGQANYVAAKAGLIGLTRAIANGGGFAEYHGERRGAWIYCFADDRSVAAAGQGCADVENSARPHGTRCGSRRGDRLFGERRSGVHHRTCAGC